MRVATLPSAAPQEISRAEKEQAAAALRHAAIVQEHTNLHYLLEYLIQHSLTDHLEPLKEFTIGVEALGKPEGYDPRLDSTVRVDISKLRSKLREHYQKKGVTSPLRIEIPKGQYDLTYTRVPPLVELPAMETATEKRASYKFTGVGEAEALFILTRLLTDHQATMAVKRSSNLTWEDLKGRQVMLLSSQKYNPQILKLPFQPKFEADRGRVTNLNPQPGEATKYRNIFKDQFGEPLETSAIISVCRGLDPNTRVTILACSSNEGTGGAAEYVTRSDTMQELSQLMKLDAVKPLPKAFQAVIRVNLNEGVPVQLGYVIHQILAS